MLNLRNQEHLRIYVDTLHALARDAHHTGNTAARDFIRGYLVGLVPDVERESFDVQLSVESAAPPPPAIVESACLSAVESALVAPEPEPVKPEPDIAKAVAKAFKPEPQGSRLLLQQSNTLQW